MPLCWFDEGYNVIRYLTLSKDSVTKPAKGRRIRNEEKDIGTAAIHGIML